ncbi:hypothetical protein E1A91_A05G019700v1 [Gossypium mustelinum]|uniref:Mediator of RNA polymerase II transcription subunit 17 n=1 Tax=Gossypium mustelinum TaxID=34275 RepID=A0A5D2Z497_GOSMU|nr:hypothetical protein E1A91_A05G019700v1 [Gossypium mustelinum]
MDGNLEISLDKLPVKRLDAIEENGLERYPPESSYDEKRVSLIRRIEFAWAVEEDEEKERKKKQKKNSSKDASATWQWQSMVENLQLAHQELSVIIDLINTVEANDAVTVAGMTRPKPLPNELMSDLAVSAATKLQCYWHLGKYFKQSANALEQQIAREARFYGALIRTHGSVGQHTRNTEKESMSDDEYVKETHLLLRDVHQSIFNDQVFDMLNCEAFNQSVGVNVTGMRENYLQLSIGQGTSLFISLVPSSESNNQAVDTANTQNVDSAIVALDSFDEVKFGEREHDTPTMKKKWGFPHRISCEIYLQQIVHEHAFLKAKDKPNLSGTPVSGQSGKDGPGLLGHFCLSLAHRIFSSRVLIELENVVCRVPYLHLMTHPTWHSRTSSWTIFMKVPQFILHAESQSPRSDFQNIKDVIKSQFHTKVVLSDDRINVEGEGAPNVAGLFKRSSEDICSVNKYDCDLVDLPVILLQQVASQVIRWLHEEALMVGIKTNRDFLSLTFDLEQGESVSLVAHVDPEDIQGGISWWLVMEYGFAEDWKLQMEMYDGTPEYRKFLGHLNLDVLYSTMMDLVTLCDGGRNH